jgi:YHS domain-containing protein
MAEHRTVTPNEDPVCGMSVDLAQAREKGQVTTYEGREYGFCGKGCLLEFGDDPETFLAAGFTPEM